MKAINAYLVKRRQLTDYGMKLSKRRNWFDNDGKPADDMQEETSPAGASSTENRVPQSRFNEINDLKNKAEGDLVKARQEMQQLRDAKLVEENKWQELAESRSKELETANAKAARTDELEAALLQTVETQIETIPENMRKLVPSHGTPQERLAWINENAADLSLPKAPDMGGGAGRQAGNAAQPALSAAELAVAKAADMTPEEYSKIQNDRLASSTEQNETLKLLGEAGLLTG